MEVSYHWSFVLSDQAAVTVFHQPPDVMESEVVIEDLDHADVDLSVTEGCGELQNEILTTVEVDFAVEGLNESPRDVRI